MKRLAAIITATAAGVLGVASPAYAFHCYNASNPVNLKASKGTFDVATGEFEVTNPAWQKKFAENPDADLTGGRITITENGDPLVTVYAHKKGVIPNGDRGTSEHGVNYLPGE